MVGPSSPPVERRVLHGWGRTADSVAGVARPSTGAEVVELLAEAGRAGRPAIARGLGRAYGDAAQCGGGVVLDATGLDTVFEPDLAAGRLHVGAGVSLDTVMRRLLPQGWWVPVTPGTRFVTVGGAIASDIHGKNHHGEGSFCHHVESLSLATPSGVRRIGPDEEPEVFWATAGGMGLTGVIVDATFRLVPVETSSMVVDVERAGDLDDCLERMRVGDAAYRYSVAWIDCLARGRSLGRSVLTRANHALPSDLPRRHGDPLAFRPRTVLSVPVVAPVGLLRPLTVAAFNEAWFRKAPRHGRRVQSVTSYFHVLDAVAHWNRLYGRRGFLQYQFVVPFGAEDVLRRVLERLSSERLASFLAVLKRFGPANPGPLSFPAEGWTLAMDLPVGGRALVETLDEFDADVAAAEGRVYLSKDGRLRPELMAAMYPRLEQWRAVRHGVDPEAVMASDLSRRLGLVAPSRRTASAVAP